MKTAVFQPTSAHAALTRISTKVAASELQFVKGLAA